LKTGLKRKNNFDEKNNEGRSFGFILFIFLFSNQINYIGFMRKKLYIHNQNGRTKTKYKEFS